MFVLMNNEWLSYRLHNGKFFFHGSDFYLILGRCYNGFSLLKTIAKIYLEVFMFVCIPDVEICYATKTDVLWFLCNYVSLLECNFFSRHYLKLVYKIMLCFSLLHIITKLYIIVCDLLFIALIFLAVSTRFK